MTAIASNAQRWFVQTLERKKTVDGYFGKRGPSGAGDDFFVRLRASLGMPPVPHAWFCSSLAGSPCDCEVTTSKSKSRFAREYATKLRGK